MRKSLNYYTFISWLQVFVSCLETSTAGVLYIAANFLLKSLLTCKLNCSFCLSRHRDMVHIYGGKFRVLIGTVRPDWCLEKDINCYRISIFYFWSWIFGKSSKFWAASCKNESNLLLVWITVCMLSNRDFFPPNRAPKMRGRHELLFAFFRNPNQNRAALWRI